MKKENHPFWCTRFGLKLEVMIPFVLAYGGGSSGAFDQGFLAAILLAVLNTAFERLLCSAQERMKRFFLSLTSGLVVVRSEEHTSELQSQSNLVCRLLLEKKKK